MSEKDDINKLLDCIDEMLEHSAIVNTSGTKEEFYFSLSKNIAVILEGETNLIARAATVAAILGDTKKYLWAGFYFVDGSQLVLGPFSGPLACFRIQKGRGVCGKAWEQGVSYLVSNVDEFPDHIACSSLSKSEIVIPLLNPVSGKIIGVLDVDHPEVGGLDKVDLRGLQAVATLVSNSQPYCEIV